jgi:hypothetical protein
MSKPARVLLDIGQAIYGASPALFGGSSYGESITGVQKVRRFVVIGETSRSWIIDGRKPFKLSKKQMRYFTGGFYIAFFTSLEAARATLSAPPPAPPYSPP